MRLIDADALHYIMEDTEKPKQMDYIRRYMVDKAPTVDAEPIRHGKWLTKEYMCGLEDHEDEWIERLAEYGDCAFCSVCGGYAGLDCDEEDALTPYCPWCGASMDLVDQETEE